MRVYQRVPEPEGEPEGEPERREAWLEGSSSCIRERSGGHDEVRREAHASLLVAKWTLDRLTHAWREAGWQRVHEGDQAQSEPELEFDERR